MEYKIVFSDDAIEDIKTIKEFYSNEKYNKEQVKRLYTQIMTALYIL